MRAAALDACSPDTPRHGGQTSRMTNDRGLSARSAQICAELTRDPRERSAVPHVAGYYAWWVMDQVLGEFDPRVPACHPNGALPGWTLLYVGISPRNGQSGETLSTRIASHRAGKVERSTFRYSLAALLPELRLELVGTTPNQRKPRYASEDRLTEWLSANAWVTVAPDDEPWATGLEAAVIGSLGPPLNGTHSSHPFKETIAAAQRRLLTAAREGIAATPTVLPASVPPTAQRSATRPARAVAPTQMRTQRVTAADIERGQIRLPRNAKSAFPAIAGPVEVELRGTRLSGHWNPRTMDDKERSGVLRLGVDRLRMIPPNTVLAIDASAPIVALN